MPFETVYMPAPSEGRFLQGEIFSSVTEYVFDPSTHEVIAQDHPFCILATQDCDLERLFEAIPEDDDLKLTGLLVYVANDVAARQGVINSANWRQAKSNSQERFHVLEACSAEIDCLDTAFPALFADFRRHFTITVGSLLHQIETGNAARRAVLLPPYREHFQQRAATFLSRVPLDRNHEMP